MVFWDNKSKDIHTNLHHSSTHNRFQRQCTMCIKTVDWSTHKTEQRLHNFIYSYSYRLCDRKYEKNFPLAWTIHYTRAATLTFKSHILTKLCTIHFATTFIQFFGYTFNKMRVSIPIYSAIQARIKKNYEHLQYN